MTTHILPVTEQSLAWAKELIDAGEVVAFHTETVYGLGADAANDAAVKKVFALKGRPADNPLIAHVHTRSADDGVSVERERESVRLMRSAHALPACAVFSDGAGIFARRRPSDRCTQREPFQTCFSRDGAACLR